MPEFLSCSVGGLKVFSSVSLFLSRLATFLAVTKEFPTSQDTQEQPGNIFIPLLAESGKWLIPR
jgi:hypothetical protein